MKKFIAKKKEPQRTHHKGAPTSAQRNLTNEAFTWTIITPLMTLPPLTQMT